MGEYLKRLFVSGPMPHGRCWGWEPWVVWTNVASDFAIFVSDLIIGITLLRVSAQRKDIVSRPVLLLFGAFILSCGLTHAMEVFNTWYAYFRLAGLIKLIAAAVSLMALLALCRILPKLLVLPDLTQVLALGDALSSEQREKNSVARQLKETQVRFRQLVEGIKDYAICLLDPLGRVKSWNPGAERITGFTEEEILDQPFSLLFPKADAASGIPAEILRRAATCGCYEYEGWRIRKDGGRYLASGVLSAFYDESGGVRGFTKIARDITVQKSHQAALRTLAESLEDQVKARVQELRESEARLQGFIRHSPAAIAFKGLDGRYLLINLRMEAALGRPSQEIMGRTDEGLLDPEALALARQRDLRATSLGQEVQEEEVWTHSNGSAHHYLVNAFPLVDATGQGWGLGIIATDITERMLADRALAQSQKLESLGVLAGGIAHDFNNILGAMQGNVELARTEASLEGAQPYLRTLQGLMARGGDLLNQMLAYAGRGRATVRTLDLNLAVEEMIHLLETSISKKARILLDLHPDLPCLEADPSQIQQVIMNLVLNASEALGEHPGTITVATRPEWITREVIGAGFKDQLLKPGPHVVLEVGDDGTGMAPEVLKRIFEPFFTTKFAGRGLGLAAIHGIVRSHQGGIQVSSHPGRGSTFRILLPSTGDQPREAPPRAPTPCRAEGTVLVVDDEGAMRDVVVKALQRAGREALDAFRRHGNRIRLILMDLTMPVMDGEESTRELRQRGAAVPILIASGFNETEVMARFEGLAIAGFIQKPFRLASLVERIQVLLRS